METDVRERERDLEQRQGNFDAWMKEQEQIIQQRYNIHCTCIHVHAGWYNVNVQQVWYTEHACTCTFCVIVKVHVHVLVHVYMYMGGLLYLSFLFLFP